MRSAAALEPPQPPREQAGARVADEDREHRRDAAGDQQPAADDAHGLQLGAQRRAEQDDRPLRLDELGHLGVLLAVPRHDAPRNAASMVSE